MSSGNIAFVMHVTGISTRHPKDFIEQAWSQRLHGRQPADSAQQAPFVQQAQHAQPAQHAQHAQQAKQTKQAASKAKQPLQFPEDIESLLPPEWGGKAAEPDKGKSKGKQKGKLSLTAQYLHPESTNQATDGTVYHRNRQQVNKSSSNSTTVKRPPHAQVKTDRGSSPPLSLASANQTAPSGTGANQAKMTNAHSFGDWMQDSADTKQPSLAAAQGRALAAGSAPPPWFQSQMLQQGPNPKPSTSAQPQPAFSSSSSAFPEDVSRPHLTGNALSSAYPQGIPRTALPGDALAWNNALPARPHTRSEERLGQLTALHHHKGGAAESADASMGKPRSRSPSPMLLEDDDLDAELGPVQPR